MNKTELYKQIGEIFKSTSKIGFDITDHDLDDPRDLFFVRFDDGYHAICLNNGYHFPKCPVNQNSICMTANIELPRNRYHDWDGKNCWACPCG